MTNYFESCQTYEEAKKIYKKLAKQLHPDLGGSLEAMQELNKQFDNFKPAEGVNNNAGGINDFFKSIINNFIKYPDIIIDIVGDWVWITGETYSIKSELKNHGFKWAAKKKAWYFGQTAGRRSNMTLDQIKDKYGCKSYGQKQTKKYIA